MSATKKKSAMDVPNGFQVKNLPTVALEVTESLPPTTPSDHYQISSDTCQKVQLLQWLKNNEMDPAVQVCKFLDYGYLFSDSHLGFSSSTQESLAFTSP